MKFYLSKIFQSVHLTYVKLEQNYLLTAKYYLFSFFSELKILLENKSIFDKEVCHLRILIVLDLDFNIFFISIILTHNITFFNLMTINFLQKYLCFYHYVNIAALDKKIYKLLKETIYFSLSFC